MRYTIHYAGGPYAGQTKHRELKRFPNVQGCVTDAKAAGCKKGVYRAVHAGVAANGDRSLVRMEWALTGGEWK